MFACLTSTGARGVGLGQTGDGAAFQGPPGISIIIITIIIVIIITGRDKFSFKKVYQTNGTCQIMFGHGIDVDDLLLLHHHGQFRM